MGEGQKLAEERGVRSFQQRGGEMGRRENEGEARSQKQSRDE